MRRLVCVASAIVLSSLIAPAAWPADSPIPTPGNPENSAVPTTITQSTAPNGDTIVTATQAGAGGGGKPGGAPAVGGSAPVSTSGVAAPPAAPPEIIEVIPICDLNGPNGAECSSDGCAPGETMAEVWAGPTAATVEPTGATECVGAGTTPPATVPPSDADIANAGKQAVDEAGFPTPAPVFQPSAATLVNLPTILAADASSASPIVRDGTLLGVPCTMTATPTYHWSLPDASPATIDTADPGRAFDGTAPADAPTDHYVTATWATTGPRILTLTVSWAVTTVRHDLGTTLAPSPPSEKTGTTDIIVKQSRAVLVGNS